MVKMMRGNREPEPQKPQGKADLSEIALIGEGRDITQGWLGPLLQSRDTVLLGRGAPDLKIYYELLRDDQVFACWQQRQMGILDQEVEVLPGRRRFADSTEADEKAADFIREVVESIPFDDVCRRMHFGVFFGRAIGEILYATEDGWTVLDDLCGGVRVRRPERFRFDSEGRLRLLTMQDAWLGELLAPEKFWIFASGGSSNDDPYGLGLGHQLYWPVYLKRNGIKAWVNRLRKSVPTPVATYRENAPLEEQRKALLAAESVGEVDGIALPEGSLLAILEAAATGSPDNQALVDSMNAAIAKIILSQAMTTDAAGGQYKGDIQMEVRQEITKADSDLLCQSFVAHCVVPLIEYNRAKLGDAVPPHVWRRSQESKDLEKESQTWLRLWQMGWSPSQEQVNSTFGGEWSPRQMPLEGVFLDQVDQVNPVNPMFSESKNAPKNAPGETVDLYGRVLRRKLGPVVDGWLDKVLALLDEVGDLTEFSDRLGELYPDLSGEAFVRIMEEGLIASSLAGRYEAQERVG